MSINVNVTGNPVKIHRGKMVTTAGTDYATEEFQKRRRLRLEQVRQQSKDIAETVRNKVQKERSKQLSELEKNGEKELKKWQARKLLQLQRQYRECLDDIGLGHSEAVLEEESDFTVHSLKENHSHIAKERGRRAMEELQLQRHRENSHKTEGFQKRRYNQAIESTRAKLVADLNRKKKNKSLFKRKKRRVSTDINIFSRLSSDLDSETEVPELLNFSSSSSGSNGNTGKLATRNSKQYQSAVSKESTDYTATANAPTKAEIINESCGKVLKEQAKLLPIPIEQKIKDKVSRNYSVDTRVSDRIRNRKILNSDYEHSIYECEMPTRYSTKISSDNYGMPKSSLEISPQSENSKVKLVSNIEESQFNSEQVDGISKLCCSKDEQEQIPNKPTVTLRTAPVSSNKLNPPLHCGTVSNKVQYYDHKNRFTKEYKMDNSSVQRIADESIEVYPSTGSEVDFMKLMYKRDRDALVRGQKALEKEKIHQNYRDMMQQLPVLQKQERIAAIASKKPTFHMSEDRLKQHEKKRQNDMENVYEKLFPKARVITIPSKNETKASSAISSLPFQTIDAKDVYPSANVGHWEIDVKPKTAPTAADLPSKQVETNLSKDFTEKAFDERADLEMAAVERRKHLEEMLQSLQFHRDKLAKEISLLPESSTLHKLVGELKNIDRLIQIGQVGKEEPVSSRRRKRCRSKKKQPTKEESNSKVSSSSLSPSYKLGNFREPFGEKDRRVSKYHVRCTSGSSSGSPSPPPKILNTVKITRERKLTRPFSLILQNTSTQTTPTVEKSTRQPDKQPLPKPSTKVPSSELKLDDRSIIPCECYPHEENEKSELCEIVIKISKDDKPQVFFSPTKLKNKQIIVKMGSEEAVAGSMQPLPSSSVKDVKLSDKPPVLPHKPESKLAEKLKVSDKLKNADRENAPNNRDEKVKVEGKNRNKFEKEKKPSSSWQEYLSQNSTSTTSYFSPPDFTSTHVPLPQSQFKHCPPHNDNTLQKPEGRLVNILKDKPQQSNFEEDVLSAYQKGKQLVEPHLLCYIKKLLSMSRTSIDDLPVSSSVSEISTPSSSIINVQSNIPLQQLENIFKYFNINMSDFEGFLSYSPDGSNVHYNTAESLTPSSTDDSRSADNRTVTPQDVRQTTIDDYSAENYPGVLAVYNKLAANCAKKIENLAVMIEKVRLEKVNMLPSPGSGSDKENSTKYLDLPAEPRLRQGEKEKNVSSSSPSSLAEQEELNRQLLEIDYGFAEQLKRMTPSQIREQFPLNGISDNGGSHDQQNDSAADIELVNRFRKLVGHKSNIKTGTVGQSRDSTAASTSELKNQQGKVQYLDLPFTPVLVDIPRLPKLETPTGLHKNNERSRPPLSKGLTVAKRFNNDISAIPHELSTIVETESLVSSRLHRSRTPESQISSKAVSPKRESNFEEERSISSTTRLTVKDKNLIDFTHTSEAAEGKGNILQTSSSDSLPDILTELMKNATARVEQPVRPTNKSSEKKHTTEISKRTLAKNTVETGLSDSSTSELENMEAMLKSLGMGWAVATLRKTQEALALTSSSSSVDVSLKQKEIKLTDTSSTSEISLREMLGRQFLAKLSSSNGKSEDTSGSSRFLRDLQDLSAIYGSETNYEKTTQRTSTPVQSSKLTEESKNNLQLHTTTIGESELSSVKANSADVNCDGVYFYSLNELSVRSKSDS